MKTFIIIAAVILLIIIALSVFIAIRFAFTVMKPKTKSSEELLKGSIKIGRFTEEYINGIETEDFEIESEFGYKLHGIIQNNNISKLPENKNRIAILCHGYTAGKITMSGYAGTLMSLGFTCVLYDHRNHGDNDKSFYTTMGYYEKFDLKTVVDYCYKRFGDSIRIITYGESMGSATVLSHHEIDDRVVLTIADCGYSDLSELFTYLLKQVYHLPVFPILNISDMFLKKYGKFSMKDVSPRKGVIKTKAPILFIHGDRDDFVPTFMSEEMVLLGGGIRKLFLAKEAGHAMSELTVPEEYKKVVTEFVTEYYK